MQEVCIKPTSTCAQTVTVKSGDTCYAIYTAAGLTEAQFLALNPGLDCGCVPFCLSLTCDCCFTCPLSCMGNGCTFEQFPSRVMLDSTALAFSVAR